MSGRAPEIPAGVSPGAASPGAASPEARGNEHRVAASPESSPEAPGPPLRVLAIYRHPAPYRDPLMDAVAALPGIDLHVAYLARLFAGTPWEAQPLRHAHSFPRGILARRIDDMEVAFHPGVIARILRSRPDVAVLSGWADPTMLAAAAACRILGIPYVLGSESWRVSGKAGLPRGLRDRIVSFVVSGARAWLPTGSRARDLLVASGADAARCHFYPTASDHRRFGALVEEHRRSAPSPREDFGLPADGVIAYVGRLIPVKAPDVALEAFALLRERGRDVEFVIVGDGPLRASMQEHRAWKNARFLGFRQPSDVARLLAATDVFVLASRDETWGAAAGEALSAGVPVVLSDGVGSAPDLVGEGGPGAVVPAGDAPALADAIAALLDRPDRRGALADAARRRALAWGHDLCLRSFLRALRDAGAALPPETAALPREAAALPREAAAIAQATDGPGTDAPATETARTPAAGSPPR